MSQRLVSRNADLSRLRADGHDVSVAKSGHLLIRQVPYLNSEKEVKRGVLVSDLDLGGEITVAPRSHVAFFAGECPCDTAGAPLPGVSENTNRPLGDELTPNHQLSRKPTTGPNPGKYTDYYEKIATYVAIICSPAKTVDPTATARTHPVVVPEEDDSPFRYLDTAATKAGIVLANDRLEGGRVAIVGVGGSGSYVLDLVAKTPVFEIHLFDPDVFLNHNAFRCPGAASLVDVSQKQFKVDYLATLYSRMRRGIVPHAYAVDEGTIEQLREMDFVFVCVDKGVGRKVVVGRLEEWGLAFIDVGMGIQLGDDNSLAGIVAVTTSTADKRDHLRRRVALVDAVGDNEYSQNVQIADLNALSASLAVIKWKKLAGYYDDGANEYFCAYTVRTNQLISEDCHAT